MNTIETTKKELVNDVRLGKLAQLIAQTLLKAFPDVRIERKKPLIRVAETCERYMDFYEAMYLFIHPGSHSADDKDLLDLYTRVRKEFEKSENLYTQAKLAFDLKEFTERFPKMQLHKSWSFFQRTISERIPEDEVSNEVFIDEVYSAMTLVIFEDTQNSNNQILNVLRHCAYAKSLEEKMVALGRILKIPDEQLTKATHGE